MTTTPTPYTGAVELAVAIAAVGVCVSSLESLRARRLYARDGLLSWPVLRTNDPLLLSGWLAPVLDRVFGEAGYRAVAWLGVLGALAAVVLYAAGQPVFLPAAVMLVVHVARLYRHHFGMSGAEHVKLVVLAGGTVALSPGASPRLVAVCAWFIALQAIMSYVAAGVWKVASKEWRSGIALVGILHTETFGTPAVAAHMRRRPRLGVVLCWSVILFECLWAGVVLYDLPLVAALLVLSGLFHLGSAVLMGLGDFVFTWPAMYPVVWAVAGAVGPRV
jgi:hypothetical protein